MTLVIKIHVFCSLIDSFTLLALRILLHEPDVSSDRRPPPNPPRRATHGGDELAPTGSRRVGGRLCPYHAALRRGRVGRPWPGRLCPSRAGLWPCCSAFRRGRAGRLWPSHAALWSGPALEGGKRGSRSRPPRPRGPRYVRCIYVLTSTLKASSC